MKKKVILLSLDALGNADFEIMAKLPGFKRILEQGTWCSRSRSVYPSLTFPSHASIITGCKPAGHGIVNNYILEPGQEPGRWYHYSGALKRKALWDYAAAAGKTMLSLSWPVSGGADIRYNLPEMNPAKPKIWNAANFAAQMGLFFSHGTPSLAVKNLLVNPSLAKAWFLGAQPDLDKGIIKLFLKNLRQYSWDIALCHIYGMDDAKHCFGAESPEAREYLPLYGDFVNRLADFVDERKKAGEAITLMVTGDHSQLDVTKAVCGNMMLAEMGYSQWKNGKLQSWDAWMDSGDGMAYLYIREGIADTAAAKAMIKTIARKFKAHPGVAKVMYPEEFLPLGCGSDAALVFEAAPGCGFDGRWHSGAENSDYSIPNQYKAIHGYLPDIPGYETLFFCYGQAVRPGEIQSMSIIDILPTVCDWLEIVPDTVDGRRIENLLEKQI
ncbi:alkaline phosphatase family protein [Breznakiella homolactica]|uniref:Alkaline phosphatase family protein n=1 Tax=Breznakiella homolactica TaxID=2798577 RepID=A0A7T8BAA1_9SPIR|nr:ectonucleotide pyrophosphatase/phosphodiesterase [Breznakiella homolactica]QQO09302.1 ectonucleotide pyrophosphatase/phosphodiesterase [Breznakiella homolactica]